jgi:hypothetical protein
VLAVSLLFTTGVCAHERGHGDHDHADHARPAGIDASDARLTPRDADSHDTGTLPPARGGNTDAAPQVRWGQRDGHRYVAANGLPDHSPGRFPNRGNPNVVTEQDYRFRLPLDPPAPDGPIHDAANARRDNGYLFGIALNGVVFEPATGLNWTPDGLRRGGRPQGWVHEAIGGNVDFGIDHANAHVQRTGAYHYHGVPTPLIRDDRPTLIGFAADGYPIYGPLGHEDPADADSPLVRLESSWQLNTDRRPSSPRGPGGVPDGRYTAD